MDPLAIALIIACSAVLLLVLTSIFSRLLKLIQVVQARRAAPTQETDTRSAAPDTRHVRFASNVEVC